MNAPKQSNLADLVWAVAELLRDNYGQADYGKVILPFTLLRRLDCVLAPTKQAVLAEKAAQKALEDTGVDVSPFLVKKSGQSFFNASLFDLPKLKGDPDNVEANLRDYVDGFSANARDIFERYSFKAEIKKLVENKLLFQVVERFASIDLSPAAVDNHGMGLMFEELIRRFSELSNAAAGAFYTPREVVRLMVDLMFSTDDEILSKPDVVRSMYDPTAGTGGMLSVAEEHLFSMNPTARLSLHGQEINAESYAVCKADMLIKGQNVSNIVLGNTLSEDGHAGKRFDYMLSNPPFGVEWKKVEKEVREEHEKLGHAGRFGPGLPRVSDGSLLFLLHLVSKMRPASEGGSRIGIVLNGSPLFTGGAGSGESEIRRHLLENDLVEAIVALPTDMFYNTGISTYVWIITNRKEDERRGKVQLVDASSFWKKMRKSLGSKRREMGDDDIADVVKIHGLYEDLRAAVVFDAEGKPVSRSILRDGEEAPAAPEGCSAEVFEVSKILPNAHFGYNTVTVERPLRLRFGVRPGSRAAVDEFEAGNAGKKNSSAKETADAARRVLERLGDGAEWPGRKEASAALAKACSDLGVEPSAALRKVLLSAVEERHPDGEIQRDPKGRPEPDADLRDTENVPLSEKIGDFMAREVAPHVSDFWVDESKTKIGYEIPFNRIFYRFVPPRELHEIDEELSSLVKEIAGLLGEMDE